MSIDLKFVELTADVLEIFFIKYQDLKYLFFMRILLFTDDTQIQTSEG